MKIGLIFENFKKFQIYKDPGLIALGLKELNINVDIITLSNEDKIEIPIRIIATNLMDKNVYNNYDAFIVYTWLSVRYNTLIKHLKSFNKPIIIKSDSDGRIASFKGPKPRFRYLRNIAYPSPTSIIKFLKEIPLIGYYTDLQKIRQIEIADKVIIETPDAAQNLAYFLTEYGRYDLIKKLHFIPNPVTDDFLNLKTKEKENIVVTIGRWEDKIQKNTISMIKILTKFLSIKRNWNVIIIGTGVPLLKQFLSLNYYPKDIINRIHILGEIPHDKIKDYLLKSKIYFMCSRYEGLPISGGEALCCGCTIIGSPIEAFKYLTKNGFYGNVASSFKNNALLGSLIYEAERHEKESINYEDIAKYWQNKLNKKKIAEKILNIIYNS